MDKFTKVKKQRLEDSHFSKERIQIVTTFTKCRLEIIVRDSGRGFLLSEGAPEDLEKRPLKCSGRRLAIISGTMDEVRYERNGAEIIMVKYLVE